MDDKFRIDSHKLHYHVARVNGWLRGEDVFPIYAEISPSGSCNHRCNYCALDFMRYRSRFLESGLLKRRLSEMAGLGLKSAMYAGEGEPLLHPDIAAIVRHTRRCGVDAAITTNGVLLREEAARQLLPCSQWIKVSINAGRKKTYARIHRCAESDFSRVIRNMSYAAKIRRKEGYACALGMQVVLLPDNADELTLLARTAKDIGMDYLVVKPYSQHPSSITRRYKNIKYQKLLGLAGDLRKLNGDGFSVVFRIRTMQKWDQAQRPYRRCYALPFWTYIDSGGDVWGCSVYLGDKRFLYGNIYRQGYAKIWGGEKRRSSLKSAKERIDANSCRVNCRMDEVNRYLWELKHPPAHVNFI
jgi:MoaA/NifB/PqqE/SkfB family radical SAM enzyme